MSYPMWLNADILQGPFKANATPVKSDEFLSRAKQYRNATLSVGWTTQFNKTLADKGYNSTHMSQMLEALRKHQITQNVTFPVRAGLAVNSQSLLKQLIKDRPNSTLTIWSGQNDTFEINKLQKLILKIGVENTYLDVPKDVYDKLDLSSNGHTVFSYSVFVLGAVLVTLLFNNVLNY